MSLRSKSSQLAALITLSSLLLLGGCTKLAKEQVGGAANAGVNHQSLYTWRTIEGGFEGNGITGKRHVRFLRPVQVAARGNFVFIVDAGARLLYRYDLGLDRLSVVMDLKGVTAGEVSDIYVNHDHSFLLVDPDAARVLHYDRNGRLLRTFQDSLNLIRPVAVTYDEQMGRVLIADGSSDDILIFTTTGQLQGVMGTRGLAQGQFLNITAITSGGDGIYATARLGHRVQVLGRDGAFVKSMQPDTVVFPLAVAVDRSLNAFVSDYLDNTIKVFRDGLFLESIGGSGAAPGRFKRISDLWYDDGFLYAVDSLNGRVQILRIEIVEEPISSDELVDDAEIDVIQATEVDAAPAEAEVVEPAAVIETVAPEVVAPSEVKSEAQLELEAAQAELTRIQNEIAAARAELEAAKEVTPVEPSGNEVEATPSANDETPAAPQVDDTPASEIQE